jgi:anti-sigma regulatory factor (Ser/Thr protein kinase)
MRASLTVRVHSGAIRELEGFVGAFAAEHGLAPEDKARTLIVLEELLTNLSRYGYPNQDEPEGVAEVTLELEGNLLTIEFGDNGRAFDPLAHAAPNLDQPVENRPVGGLGLHIVRELADEAHYSRHSDRNVIRLSRHIALPKGPGPEL